MRHLDGDVTYYFFAKLKKGWSNDIWAKCALI